MPAAGEENRKEAGTDPEGFDLVSAVGCERAAHRLPTLARARAWEKESSAAQQGWESLDPAPDVDEGVDLPLPEAVQESQPLLDSFEAFEPFEPFEPFEDVRPVPRKGPLGLLSAAISQAASEPPELEWPDSTRRASSWAESGGRSLAPLSYAAIAERDVSHLAPPLSPPDASPSVSPPDREASSPPGSDGAVGPSLADREASDRSALLSYAAIAGSEPRAVRKHGGRGKSQGKSENKSQDKTRGKSRGKQAQAGKRSKGVSAGGGKKEVSPSAVANAVLAEVEQHSEAGRLDESLSILEKTLPRLRADVGQKKVNIEGYLRLACKKAALLKRTGDLRKGAEQLEWALADYRRHEAFWPQDCHKRDLGPVLISLWESLHHTFRTREANALLPELLETFSNRPVRCCAIELRDAYYKREFLRVPELARTLRDSIRRRYPDPEWHNDYPLSYFYEGSALWSCRQQDAAIACIRRTVSLLQEHVADPSPHHQGRYSYNAVINLGKMTASCCRWMRQRHRLEMAEAMLEAFDRFRSEHKVPGHPDIVRERSALRVLCGDNAGALALLDEGIRDFPMNKRLFLTRVKVRCSLAVSEERCLPDALWDELTGYANNNPGHYLVQLIWNQQGLYRLLFQLAQAGRMTAPLQAEQRRLERSTKALSALFPESYMIWSLRANISRFAVPWDQKATDELYRQARTIFEQGGGSAEAYGEPDTMNARFCLSDDLSDDAFSADLHDSFKRLKEKALAALVDRRP